MEKQFEYRLNALRIASLVCLLAATSSCTPFVRSTKLYHGKVRGPQEIARVIIPAPAFPCEVDDGARTFSIREVRGQFKVLEFEPGPHNFKLKLEHRRAGLVVYSGDGPQVYFEGEPGSVFVVSLHGMGAFQVAYRINGPYPARLEVPGTDRTITLDVRSEMGRDSDTDHLVYRVEEGGKVEEFDPFRAGPYPAYSENGEHMGFFLKNGRKDFQVVIDGVVVPHHFERVYTDLFFSPDGKHYFLAVHQGGRKGVLFDGKIIRDKYLKFYGYTVRYSPDSKHVAYVAIMQDNKQHLFLDGRDFGPYRRVDFDSLAFDEESTRFSYYVEYEANQGWHPKQVSLEGHSIEDVLR